MAEESIQDLMAKCEQLTADKTRNEKALREAERQIADLKRELAVTKSLYQSVKATLNDIESTNGYKALEKYWHFRNDFLLKWYYKLKRALSAPAAPAAPAAPVQEVKPPAPQLPEKTPGKRLKVASVLDVFSDSCFAVECDLIRIRPDNWEALLDSEKPDMLLVESAWNGNNGAWQYLIGTYGGSSRDTLRALISGCKARKIPTVFWNKEDPPHFDKFVEAASLFDFVFTTDENCLPRYREMCGHDRVFALPFAAAPTIHNPALTAPRDRDVCFAGTYYANRFEDRRKQMDVLLECAKDYNFDIYDRMHGNTSVGYENYLFPEPFRKFIRGRLEYNDMLKAYHRYRFFLNTNSVVDSGTMFSRRVFELLACGTPVITTPSVGIKRFFGELVPEIVSVDAGKKLMDHLIADQEHYQRIQALGVREVLGKHTYAIRLGEICRRAGLPWQPEEKRVAVFAIPGKDMVKKLAGQTLKPVLVLLRQEDMGAADELKNAGFKVELFQENWSAILEKHQINCAAWMDFANFYGKGYLLDCALTMLYEQGRVTAVDNGADLYMTSNELPAATVAAQTPAWQEIAGVMNSAFASGLQQKVALAGQIRSRFEFVPAAAAGDKQVCQKSLL